MTGEEVIIDPIRRAKGICVNCSSVKGVILFDKYEETTEEIAQLIIELTRKMPIPKKIALNPFAFIFEL